MESFIHRINLQRALHIEQSTYNASRVKIMLPILPKILSLCMRSLLRESRIGQQQLNVCVMDRVNGVDGA